MILQAKRQINQHKENFAKDNSVSEQSDFSWKDGCIVEDLSLKLILEDLSKNIIIFLNREALKNHFNLYVGACCFLFIYLFYPSRICFKHFNAPTLLAVYYKGEINFVFH